MKEITIIKPADKELRKIKTEDKKLFAEIRYKLEQLAKGNYDALNIKPIKRKNGYHIQEIVIKSPNSYRVFYFEIAIKDKIWIIDGRRKKVNAFDSAYFKVLDKRIEAILEDENNENE